MEGLAGYIVTGLVSLIVGLILKSIQMKPKLVFWQPHYALFEVSDPQVTVQTDAINIQNIGKKEAESVDIIFREKPDFIKLTPPVQFTEQSTPNGEFIVSLSSLAPKEFITLHILSYATPPRIESIRSKAGTAEMIPFQMQRKYPKWVEYFIAFIMLIGFGFFIYWLSLAVFHVSKIIGVL